MRPYLRHFIVWSLFWALLAPARAGLAQSEHAGHGAAAPAQEAPAALEKESATLAKEAAASAEEQTPAPAPAKPARKKAKRAPAKDAAPAAKPETAAPAPAAKPETAAPAPAAEHDGHAAAAPATKPGAAAPAPAKVYISPEQQQLIGVKTGLVQEMSLDKTIRAVGVVDYDEKRLYTIAPKVNGWIENLYVDYTGRYVKRGEPLLSIYSPEMVSTQAEYLIALRSVKELAKSPYPEVAASGHDLAAAARQRLKYWDIGERQIKAIEKSGTPMRTLTLHSPYNGFVLERLAFKGMYVTAGMPLFKLADLSVVWLNVDVYEADLPYIRIGQEAKLSLSTFPDAPFSGKVIYIYPALDSRTRTARIRIELPNGQGKLKPEMYANVEIMVRLGTKVVVPDGAIIDTGLRRVAIVDLGKGAFVFRDVALGAKVEGFYEVVSGLKVGEKVVTSANFLVDSETRFKEALGGSSGAHAGHGK